MTPNDNNGTTETLFVPIQTKHDNNLQKNFWKGEINISLLLTSVPVHYQQLSNYL